MSEEPKTNSSFMQQLDAWSDGNVIFPLMQTEPEAGSWEETVERVKKVLK